MPHAQLVVPPILPKISIWRKTGPKTLGVLEGGGGREFEQAPRIVYFFARNRA